MTGRERILTTLSGNIADRVPVSPFVQEEFLCYLYPDKTSVDRVHDGAVCARDFGFDLMARPKIYERPNFLRRTYPNWEVSVSEERSGGNYLKKTEVKTPGRTLRTVAAGPDCGAATAGIHLATTEYLLKDGDDLEAFIRYMPAAIPIDEMRITVAGWKSATGDTGIVVPWGWGTVYNHAAEFRNVEQLMMDAYVHPEMYSALMDKLSQAQSSYNAALVRAGVECIGMQGNIANGAMVGYDFYREHIQPYEQRVVDAIKAEGGYVLLHNCGYAKALYHNYIEIGITVWETVAAPPQGDNDLREAKENIGAHMCIMGNLDQVHFLKTATPAEVAARTEEMVSTGKPGGNYIFAASDYIERDTPIENVKTMIESAKTFGRY